MFQWFITHLLSHMLAALQVMVTVWKDLRLNNGYNAMLGGGVTASSVMTKDNSTSSVGFVTSWMYQLLQS